MAPVHAHAFQKAEGNGPFAVLGPLDCRQEGEPAERATQPTGVAGHQHVIQGRERPEEADILEGADHAQARTIMGRPPVQPPAVQ
jgi:hypothetical protein